MAQVHETSFHDLDEGTAALIIQLQIQDADSYSSNFKGKGREDDVSDESLAFNLQREELEKISSFLSDKRMTRSIASAVQNDGPILSDVLSQEDIVARDQLIAQRLMNNVELSNTDSLEVNSEANFLDDELLDKLQFLYVSGGGESLLQEHSDRELESLDGGQAESSTWTASRAINPSQTNRRCEACREAKPFFDLARVPCRHEYCRDCLGELFHASMTDESLFPPRCCGQPIPVARVRIFLKSKLVQEFEKKKIELKTPNRTYCWAPTCSMFIRTMYINEEVGTCPDCGERTCITCKAAAHDGDCPNDTALQQVLTAARENGWQRCYSCWRVVELDHGCNHMTCHCGAQFCYVCGEQWKNCNCAQWDEHRLLARANQIVDREPGPLVNIQNTRERMVADPLIIPPAARPREIETPENPPHTTREALITRTIQNLRDNHECAHTNWRWVQGPHRCEECSCLLSQYISECRQCQLHACNRCRRNRL